MQVLHSAAHVPHEARGACLAIGNFDGVHRGHQALIAAAVKEARRLRKPAGVMVFEPHPREFFQPHEPHFTLTPLNEKLRLLRTSGIDLAVVLPFDAALAGLTAQDFIERILVAGLGVGHVVIGYDFFFGKGRTGTPETMRAAGAETGFGVTVVAPVAEAGEVFSSSGIRLKLAQGDVQGAAHDLDRWWHVSGKVVGGARRGTGLGFPTANVPMPKGTALGHGIYAVRVLVGRDAHVASKTRDSHDTSKTRDSHDGAAYLGTRPTFDNGMPVLEVFLFDFDGDLYGREITVEFIGFIRADRKFDSAEALKTQMELDVTEARRVLAAATAKPV
jgi:riboflavin kinase/FMN adenylyltransferase